MTRPTDADAPGQPSTLPLFIYGSLRDPGLRDFLFGERPDLATRPATLRGFSRHHSDAIGYPFVIPDAEAQVEGELLYGLRADDYVVIDAYEDVADGLYARVQVTVEAEVGPVAAWTYVKGPNAP